MKLSVSTWGYYDKTREEAFETIGGLGVQGVEVIAHQPCFHVDTNFTDEQVAYVKGLLAKNGLEISAVSPATEFLQFTDEAMQAQLDHVRKVADLCVRLGADHMRIFAGGRIPEDRTPEECIQVVITGLQESVKITKAAGVRASVENHGQFGRTIEPFMRVLNAVPEIGITLHTGGIDRMTDDYLGMVRDLAPRILHTHLNDQPAGHVRGMPPSPLGEGVLDIEAILAILGKAGYSGYYNVEVGAQAGVDVTPVIRKSLDFLRQVLA